MHSDQSSLNQHALKEQAMKHNKNISKMATTVGRVQTADCVLTCNTISFV